MLHLVHTAGHQGCTHPLQPNLFLTTPLYTAQIHEAIEYLSLKFYKKKFQLCLSGTNTVSCPTVQLLYFGRSGRTESTTLKRVVKCRKLRYFGHVVKAQNLCTSILHRRYKTQRKEDPVDAGQTTSGSGLV